MFPVLEEMLFFVTLINNNSSTTSLVPMANHTTSHQGVSVTPMLHAEFDCLKGCHFPLLVPTTKSNKCHESRYHSLQGGSSTPLFKAPTP